MVDLNHFEYISSALYFAVDDDVNDFSRQAILLSPATLLRRNEMKKLC